MRLRLPIVLLAGLLLAAAPAHAATSVSLGPGEDPYLVTDSTGVTHAAWVVNNPSGDDFVRYCRIPRGGTTCERTQDLSAPGEIVNDRAYVVLRTDDKLEITTATVSGPPSPWWAWDSGNGGQTWGARHQIGTAYHFTGSENNNTPVAFGPGVAISKATANVALHYQQMNLDGSTPGGAYAALSGSYVHSPSVAVAGSTPLVAADDGSNVGLFRYSGSGDIHNAANWTGPTVITGEENPSFSNGAAGLFLVTRTTSGLYIRVRRWTGSGFGAPAQLRDNATTWADLSQSLSGELVVVYTYGSDTMRESRSSDAGATWSAPVDILREGGSVWATRGSIAPDGQGLALFFRSNEVRATRLDPIVDPPAPGPGAGGGGPPPPPPPPPPPGLYSGPFSTASQSAGATEVRFITPRACVPAGTPFEVRVTSRDRRRLAGRRRARIRSVVFSLDRRRVATDRRAAFSARLSTTGLSAGAHTLSAGVSLRYVGRPRRSLRRTLTARLRVC